MRINWNKHNSYLKGLPLSILLFMGFFLFLILGVHDISSSSNGENLKLLQESVKRATVQCYAIEGMYPPNIQYLEDHYGVTFDHEKYIVHYEVFASNILPDIKVIDLIGE